MKHPLIQLGIMASFAAVLGWIWRLVYQREADRSDRLEAEVRRLNVQRAESFVRRDVYDNVEVARDRLEEALRVQILPAMEAASKATHESFGVLTELYRQQSTRLRTFDEASSDNTNEG